MVVIFCVCGMCLRYTCFCKRGPEETIYVRMSYSHSKEQWSVRCGLISKLHYRLLERRVYGVCSGGDTINTSACQDVLSKKKHLFSHKVPLFVITAL